MASTPKHSSHNHTRPHLYQTLVRIAHDISYIGIMIHENTENNENYTQASVLRHINSSELTHTANYARTYTKTTVTAKKLGDFPSQANSIGDTNSIR